MSIMLESLHVGLVELALSGLAALYDDQQKLFAYQILDGQRVQMPLHRSVLYTAMSLLGLMKARQYGWEETGIDLEQSLESLVAHRDDIGRRGEIGVLLWADAYHGGSYRHMLLPSLRTLMQPQTLARLSSMELAWMLIGLCYTYQRVETSEDLKSLCLTVYQAVKNNFNSRTGLMRHTGSGGGLLAIRSQVANFADQIYNVYAFSTFYETFHQDEALQAGLQLARRLCAFQGEQGQWWWHYHARRGIVVSRYPVFGVHQDGMAPMALLKLAAISGQDFTDAIQRGLNWLQRNNELRQEMIVWDRQIIWRDIQRTPPAVYLRYPAMVLAQTGFTGVVSRLNGVGGFRLNPEMRPYHLGWLLYAFAGEK